jgi:hypothetical protein
VERSALLAKFKDARKVRIGETLHLGDRPDMAQLIKRGLARGLTVTENGVEQWIEETPLLDPSKEGLAAFTWHRDRKRVKVALFLYSRRERAAGERLSARRPSTKQPQGHAWRSIRTVLGGDE